MPSAISLTRPLWTPVRGMLIEPRGAADLDGVHRRRGPLGATFVATPPSPETRRTKIDRAMSDPKSFLRRTVSWTVVLLAVAGGISWWLSGRDMALGVALGGLVGLANLLLLTRALAKVIANPEQHRPVAGKNWVLPAAIVLKWPFLLLALGLILWYLPARPEGVAAGVAITLLAASLAAIRGSKPPPTGTSTRSTS